MRIQNNIRIPKKNCSSYRTKNNNVYFPEIEHGIPDTLFLFNETVKNQETLFYSIYDHGVRTAVEWTSAFQIEQQIIGNMPTNLYRGTFGLILKM